MLSISRDKVPTETGKKLYDLLVKSWNDPEFIYGTLMLLRGDEQKQKMIDLIKKDGVNDSDTIILATLDIRDGLI